MGAGELGWIEEALAPLRRGVASFDADTVTSAYLPRVVDLLTEIEHLAVAARIVVARRVAEVQLHRGTTSPTAADWLALRTGQPVGKAISEITTSEKLEAHPEVDAAARRGVLSAGQLHEIVDAVHVNRSATRRLLESARVNGFRQHQEICRLAKAEGQTEKDKAAAEARVHRNRRCRAYTGHDGAKGLDILGPADQVALIKAGMERYKREAFEAARKDGRREPSEAYSFDAMVAMARDALSGAVSAIRPATLPSQRVHLVIPAQLLAPDADESGATCDVLGVGPVSAAKALQLLPGAVWDLVITKGVDVLHYTHLGRSPTMAQRVGLLLRNKGRCEAEGCDRLATEIDHEPPWEQTNHTRLDELQGLCSATHAAKTRRQRLARQGSGP